jgi:hypothetical protein
MKRYLNKGGDAGVAAYDYDTDWIRIKFTHDGTYEYTRTGIGAAHLRAMKRLAESGDGLTTYINQHPEVRDGYSKRIA